MKIEFLTKVFQPSAYILEITEELFTRAAVAIGLPVSDLSLVLVADDERYGEAVHRIQPSGGYTNHPSGYRGMAKTSLLREPDGSKSSAIVFHLNALGCALTAEFPTEGLKRDPLAEESCTYLVYHELGHCLDNLRRPDRAEPTAVRPGYGFEISQFAQYHAHVVEEEYVASAFAAPWMTETVYQEVFSLMKTQLELGREEALQFQEQYDSDPSALTLLASSVAGWCWSLLVQFGKMAGSRHVNRDLAESSPLWVEPDDDTVIQLLTEFEQDFAKYWAIYPSWTESPAFLRQTWQTLALFEGFKFVEDTRGSAVFWQ